MATLAENDHSTSMGMLICRSGHQRARNHYMYQQAAPPRPLSLALDWHQHFHPSGQHSHPRGQVQQRTGTPYGHKISPPHPSPDEYRASGHAKRVNNTCSGSHGVCMLCANYVAKPTPPQALC